MDSKRQQIRDAIKTRFEGISIVNGYKTDVGLNIHRWKVTSFPEGTAYGLIFKDMANEREDGGPIGAFRWGLNIEVQVEAAGGEFTDNEALEITEDIYKAIDTDETWGGLAQWTEQPSDSMVIEQAETIIGAVKISFRIIYDAPKWQM